MVLLRIGVGYVLIGGGCDQSEKGRVQGDKRNSERGEKEIERESVRC